MDTGCLLLLAHRTQQSEPLRQREAELLQVVALKILQVISKQVELGFSEKPRTAFDVAANRKAPEMTMSATPKPASLPLITSRSTAAPNNEKSKGWATLVHSSPKTPPAALYKGPVRNASASAASLCGNQPVSCGVASMASGA